MFTPSYVTGRMARLAVSSHLAESLNSISCQVSASDNVFASIISACARHIAEGANVPPSAFALYFTIIDAIENDRLEEAAGAALRIETLISPIGRSPMMVLPMSKAALGNERYNLVCNAFADEFFGKEFLGEIDTLSFAEREASVATALGRIKTDIPELFAELNETIDEIILAKGAQTSGEYTFDGASSLNYWGAITLNASLPKTQLRLIEALAHEAAHNTLFGLSPHDHFVLNEDSERYASPLRDDLRPLDGIYHATFVLARMHYAISRIAQSSDATADERQEAALLLASYKNNFFAGHSVLQNHAHYTSNGAVIMAEAENYMTSHA